MTDSFDAWVDSGCEDQRPIKQQIEELSELEYEQRRDDAAKELKVRVSVLDKEVQAARPNDTEREEASPFNDVEPWHSVVDGALLLAELRKAIQRFCVLPDHSDVLMAAWILHAWTHDTADLSPILAYVSPEKRCGKTTALSVVGALAPRAMHNINMSTSVLFRVVEMHCRQF